MTVISPVVVVLWSSVTVTIVLVVTSLTLGEVTKGVAVRGLDIEVCVVVDTASRVVATVELFPVSIDWVFVSVQVQSVVSVNIDVTTTVMISSSVAALAMGQHPRTEAISRWNSGNLIWRAIAVVTHGLN